VKVLAFALAGLALTIGSSSGWRTFHANGISVRYPPGWYATSAPLTPVTAPAQVLAVASYPLPKGDAGADGCEPRAALARMPAGGAFVFGWGYGEVSSQTGVRPADFPRRPKNFRLTNFGRYECMGPSYMIRFSDGGWAYQIHVYLGLNATTETRQTALRILDSFRHTKSPR